MIEILFLLTVIFFALNMGCSGISPSFAALYGADIVSFRNAAILFAVFVFAGAVLFGGNVSKTLGKGLISQQFLDFNTAFIIILAAAISLCIANLLHIPQSTSQTTVGAILGAAACFGSLNLSKLYYILFFWAFLPVLSFAISRLVMKQVYPPSQKNLWFYQKILSNEKLLKRSALFAGIYVAFSIGTNNVANIAGPLSGAGIMRSQTALLLSAPLFGIGALFFGKNSLKAIGQQMVPLGIFTASVVSIITATLLLFASLIGIPQSLVQLNIASIIGVSVIKDGHRNTLNHPLTRKITLVWIITPIIAFLLSFALIKLSGASH